jgi:hypothetical protein
MPRTKGYGANPAQGAILRNDLGKHTFNGANTWVLRAVAQLYPEYETDLTEAGVNDSIQRSHEMLAAASDLDHLGEPAQLEDNALAARQHRRKVAHPAHEREHGRRMQHEPHGAC